MAVTVPVTIQGKVVVITGASSGIGEATARYFARAGATVILAARGEKDLEGIVADLKKQGRAASWLRCDVTSKDDVKALREHVEKEHGRCDVLVNNAGIPGGGPLAKLSLEEIDAIVGTNLLGTLYCTKEFLPMLEAATGHIVNVASLAGRYALPGASVYTATKHAVVALSESLYEELKMSGVMVTSVNPGLVRTRGFPMDDVNRDPVLRKFIMAPERVAGAILEAVRKRKGPELSVPKWQAAGQAVRVLAPPLYRKAIDTIVRRGRGRDHHTS